MNTLPAQHRFFSVVKEKLQPNVSLVDEVADILGISTDSAYRRIRDEKELSFTEIEKLCTFYAISVDMIFNEKAQETVSFRYNPIDGSVFTFEDYLKSVASSMRGIVTGPQKEMIYSAKDIPLFYLFYYDEIASFKTFVWQKTLLGIPGLDDKKFLISDTPPSLLKLGRQSLTHYLHINSSELWNIESFHSLFCQIEFYCEAGLFADPAEASLIVAKTGELITHLRKQAELGKKFLPGSQQPFESNYKMYTNDVLLSDNTVLGMMGGHTVAFLTHNALNFLSTNNEKFCNTTKDWYNNLIRKSSLISSVGEKERNRFFAGVTTNYEKLKENVRHILR